MAEIGSVLGGRYRLVELLGQGGMATIYRATDAQLGRDVAVKVLRPEYGRDPDFVARFQLEARSVASLSNPNTVIVHDFGMDPAGPYIVMDYVDGEDLATLLRRTGPLQPRQAARIAAEVARGLAAAHARGIVHRDIKPGNILLAQDGRVRVTDFGIARALAESQMTLPGTTLGSVQYMSPEQARGETATERSDVYSLGVVLFEMLAGRRPFEGDSAASIAMARLTPPVPMPSQHRSGIPPVLEAICRRAMAIDPTERFSSANAMADALEGELADRAAAGRAAAAASGGAAAGRAGAVGPAAASTVAAGVARANPPSGIPYAADAYAGSDADADASGGGASRPSGGTGGGGGGRGGAGGEADSGCGGGAGSAWTWIAGLLGLAILVVAGFLIFRFATGGAKPPAPEQVVVPSFVGQTLDQARPLAEAKGLVLVATEFVKSSDQPEGTITAQDPVSDSTVDKGSTVNVTVVTGKDLVAIPDVRNQTLVEALKALVEAGLSPGTKTDAFDPTVPEGAVISTSPTTGTEVAKGTIVDYVLSKGPEPTPTPTPTPEPTPTPTPPPTPAPTPTPTPGPSNVGSYVCMTFAAAQVAIEADGFNVGAITYLPPGYTGTDPNQVVTAQSPAPGTNRPHGSTIDLSVYDSASLATCPPGP